MLSFNASATNVQLGRLINISSTWAITPNTLINGLNQTVISLEAVGLPYHGYGSIDAVNIAKAQYFNTAWVYRAGTSVPSDNPPSTSSGIIGYWLNGVAIYSANGGTDAPFGQNPYAANWQYNASYAEGQLLGYSFYEDYAGGKATKSHIYNYRDYSFAPIWISGQGGKPFSSTVHGLADADEIPYYSGSLTHPDGHSKILGFALDGYPIYGPYGYSNPINNQTTIRSLQTSYTLNTTRNGINVPLVSAYPLGTFVQDYTYTGTGDLDTHNGRYCVTPDYPNGTYAYFCTIDGLGRPVYPYVIGNTFYGYVDTITAEQAPGSNTAYPQWVTPAGNLGKIQALQFFELGLQAVDPTGNPDGSDVNYSMVSGKMPAGLQLDNSGKVTGNPKDTYSIDGVPEEVDQDRTSQFTVRATSASGKITDRNFIITVTGNYVPQLLTSNYTPIGTFLDGTEVSVQLSAIDLNNDALTYSVLGGSLPPGLTLSPSGVISGVIIPNVSKNNNAITGWDESYWSENPWQFTTMSGNFTYRFTVSVTDGKSFDTRDYSIVVYSHNDIRADNNALTADSTIITADTSNTRTPVLLTKDMGDYATFTAGNYFAYKFNAVDYDNVPIIYGIVGVGAGGFDQSAWDSSAWDQISFSFPYGLTLDPNTGWLTGYIPENIATLDQWVSTDPITGITSGSLYEHTYTFALQVQNAFDSTAVSPYRQFSITILSALDLSVTWDTPVDLGYINAGSVSSLAVAASAKSGRKLYYSLISKFIEPVTGKAVGSRLPQGLQLLNDGSISGRASFQTFSLDKGSTTFDVANYNSGQYTDITTIDTTYRFTIQAADYSKNVSGAQTFTLKLKTVTYAPYDNLYLVCKPSTAKRTLLSTILGNTDFFEPNDIYRPNDPWWGVQSDIKILTGYGLTASQSSAYIAAMQTRHYNKKFYFGDYHYAQATDSAGNHLYDVIYVDLREDTKTYTTINGTTTKVIPADRLTTSGIENLVTNFDTNYTTFDRKHLRLVDPMSSVVIYPNDIDLMTNDIIVAVGQSNSNTLPQWQTSTQANGKILGFQTAAVLAYLKPGTGERVLYKLNSLVSHDIKLIPFVADRYILDNNQDINFNVNTHTWIKKIYTTFDNGYTGSQIAATVDYAIDIPFDHINGQNISSVIALGGLDGDVSGDWNNKTIIFATQENYNSTLYPSLTNNGWNRFDTVIPGYNEVNNGTSLVNQRGGVWLVTVGNNLVTLTFKQQISLGGNSNVLVRFGARAGKTLSYSSAGVNINGQTVPAYVLVDTNSFQKKVPMTFDYNSTQFINNEDQYSVPFASDSYLKFPRVSALQ